MPAKPPTQSTLPGRLRRSEPIRLLGERIVSAEGRDIRSDIERAVLNIRKGKPCFQSVDDVRTTQFEPIGFIGGEARRRLTNEIE